MSDQPQYTYRDRVKFACFSFALEQGLDEGQMIALFTKAAEMVRGMEKTALLDELGTAAGIGLGVAAAPFAAGIAGHLGYHTGQLLRRGREGYIPSPEEVHLADEAANYEQAIEEIKQRVYLNRLREQQRQAPSSRRMF